MDNVFYLVYSLCFYSKNQLNYNQFSGGSVNAIKTLVLKGFKCFQSLEERICYIRVKIFSKRYCESL